MLVVQYVWVYCPFEMYWNDYFGEKTTKRNEILINCIAVCFCRFLTRKKTLIIDSILLKGAPYHTEATTQLSRQIDAFFVSQVVPVVREFIMFLKIKNFLSEIFTCFF